MLPVEKHVPVLSLDSRTVMMYGPAKVGKTTFAAAFSESALIMECDPGGADFLPCWKVPVADWKTFLERCKEVIEDKDKRFKAIVIDTVDRAWQLCREHVCAQFKVKHESEDSNFGRVWDAVKNEFLRVIGKIRSAGVGLWFISHASTREVKVGVAKRNVTTFSVQDKVGRMVASIADIIWYLDINELGERDLRCLPEDSLECGDRSRLVCENITYSTPAEGVEKIKAIVAKKGK